MKPGEENPYDLFMRECPSIFRPFNDLVDAQRALPGLDPKTKQLINIAIQASNKNPRGVFFHAGRARSCGATRDEIIGVVCDEPAPLGPCDRTRIPACSSEGVRFWRRRRNGDKKIAMYPF